MVEFVPKAVDVKVRYSLHVVEQCIAEPQHKTLSYAFLQVPLVNMNPSNIINKCKHAFAMQRNIVTHFDNHTSLSHSTDIARKDNTILAAWPRSLLYGVIIDRPRGFPVTLSILCSIGIPHVSEVVWEIN